MHSLGEATAPTHLLCSPLHTHHEKSNTESAEDASNVVNLTENLLRWARGLADRVIIAKDNQEEADQVPDADHDSGISPVSSGLSDELSPHWRWAEGQDREDDSADVCATLVHWHELGSSGQSDQLVKTGTEAADDHASNGNVDIVRRADDNRADQKADLSKCCHPSSTEDIRHGAHERTKSRVGNQIADDHPQVTSASTTNLAIDVGKDGSKDVERNLGTDPEEGHSRQ